VTFRQALSAIWQRRLVIIAVVVLAMAVAAIFLARQTPVYTSTTTVRMSALATTASTSGQIGTAAVDFDPGSITSPAVLGPAAKKLGEPAADAASWGVTEATADTTSQNAPIVVTITANGSTSAQAQAHAAAVAKSYNTYLAGQMAKAKTAAEAQAAKWNASAEDFQKQVNANPANSIAQSNLAGAISSLASANTTIDTINNAGAPLTVTQIATPGEFQGTSPLIALAVALAAGLVAGIGIALIWDAFDDRLRGEDEIETLTGVPSLGELALDKRMLRRGDWLPAASRKRTSLNEGLRALRTTLQVLLPQGHDVVVLTSVEPGDGKTFVSSNLALAWARTGKRVILVGGDLRRPALDEYFGDVATGPGLTELLQGTAVRGKVPSTKEVAANVNATKYRGLAILPAGSEPWDPADLLAVDGLGDIVKSLRSMCDIVVIDSPPALALVDASLLAVHADGAVLVASVRRTRRKLMVETVRAMASNGITVLGIVANRSRRRIPKSYSAYYGGSGSSVRRRPGGAQRSEVAQQQQQPAEEVLPDYDEGFIEGGDDFDEAATTALNDSAQSTSERESEQAAAEDESTHNDSVGRKDSAEDEKV
jgi:capsular exopolysaccharide synthesis family protein